MLSSPVPREHCAALSLLLVCAISVAFLASQRLQPAEAATAAPNNATRHVTAKTLAFVPAGNTIVINSTADAQNASDGLCTLREAIAAANDNVASDATAGECAAGSSGSDTVDLTGLTGTITLTSGLPFITSDMTINGPGANQLTVQRSMAVGTPNFRIFTIGSGAVVTISGLTISNGNAGGTSTDGYGGGIFNQGSLTLNDSNVYGNTSLSIGGGIYHAGPSLTINDCNIGGTAAGQPNSSGESGASAGIHAEGPIIINGGTISGNTGGCGIALNSTGTLNGVTIVGNINKLHGGGVIILPNGDVDMVNCLISGNSTTPANSQGGGIHNVGGSLALINSTVSGNQAKGSGGGIFYTNSFFNPNATMRIVNSTITNNRADADGFNGGAENGGGIAADSHLLLSNSLVAGNFFGLSSVANDVSSNVSSSSSFNLIGVCENCGLTNGVNNNQVGVANPRLAVLANNGGLTLTHALLPGSPALDAGSNALSEGEGLTTDQRGMGFTREADSTDVNTTQTVDIGAFEAHASIEDISDKVTAEDTAIFFDFNVADATAITSVTASSSNTTLVPNLSANLSVTGSGATRTLNIMPAVNQFGTSIITVTVTSGSESMSDTFVLTVTAVADTPAATPAITTVNTQTTSGLVIARNTFDGSEVTHFKITNITNGTLFKNNGTSQINNNDFITFAEGNAGLRFTPANNLASPSSTFSFQVQGATNSGGAGLGPATTATITVNCGPGVVTNTNDSGVGSLRDTINTACPGGTISFAAALTSGGPATISFSSGELVIDKNLSVTGPGATLLTVRRSTAAGTPQFRIFSVNSGVTVQMSGLTVANGRVPDGASSLSGFRGGGILNFGTLTLKNVTITGNRTGNGGDGGAGGAGGSGGGILNSFGTLIVINSTVSDNQTGNGGNGSGSGGSAGGGAGIFNEGGSLTLLNSTVSGNQTGNGGSVVTGPGGFGGGGGGLLNSGTITLINTTISSNHTGNGGSSTSGSIGPGGFGGGISNSGTLTVINSTVALNSTGNGVGANGSSGGGIVTNTLGLTNLRNTIVANNTIGAGSGPDLSGPFNSDDYNLIGNTAGATITGSTSHNIVNQNTNLGSLVNNGGQTQTMLPLPGSPAISAGDPLNLPADTFDLDGDSDTAEPLPLDQRGFARVVGTNFDIGAVEVNYTIMADAATPQSAIINTAFATQFQARIQESGVNQSGIPITFTAPVTGPSGSFSGSATVNTNTSGIATAPVFTANGIAGGYNVVASLSGGSPATNFSLINMPLVAVNDVSITEGNSGTASLTFTVTLSTASNLMVSVNCATADGSATTADNDYQSASGLLTFNPGDLTKTVTVLVNGDQKTEADETLFVVLSSPVNAAFGDSQGTGTILNDDTLQLMLDTSGPDPNQAAALDSLLLVRDPLHALSFAEWWNLGDDKNTRVIVFASDLTLSLGESVTVELIDRNGQIQNITAEDVRPLPNLSFTQVKFRLPNGIPAGNCLITLKAQGRTSNTGTFRISP